MRTLLAVALASSLLGCKRSGQASAPAERPDNAAVRYADGLKNDLDRAKAAEEKANDAIRRTSQAVQQASEPVQ